MFPATAALLTGIREPFEIHSVEVDDPRPSEVVVRIAACGLCQSDLLVQSGSTPVQLPAVLGHEGAGVVEQVGRDVRMLAPGDHVVLQSASCGRCLMCLRGHPGHCTRWLELNLLGGRRLDGSATVRRDGSELAAHFFGQSSLATYAVADERTAVRVRPDAPLELLGPLGCGVQTGAQGLLNVLRPRPGSTLAVFGSGAVGLSAIIAAANLTGTFAIAVDVHPGRLRLAEELGASYTCNAAEVDPVEAIRDHTHGRGVDYALETSGAPGALRQAVESLAPLGTCGVISAHGFDAETTLRILPFISEGLTLVGLNQGEVVAQESIPALVELYLAGRFPFDRLVRAYDLADINAAVAAMQDGTAVKPVLRMPGS